MSEAHKLFRDMQGLNKFCRVFDPEKEAMKNLQRRKNRLRNSLERIRSR